MEKDLGYRKIQCTGRGAYIISLPKGWVQNVGLKKGSEVAFKLQDDFSMFLVPRKIMERQELEKPQLKEYCISAEPREDIQSLCRKIKSLYVIGADLIHVCLKGGENVSKYKIAINSLAKDILLGSEIVDETPNEITLQILISHTEFPLEKAVRRMAVIALSANKDAITALKSKDQELLQGVVNAYKDVNRLNLYVVRQLKFGIERNMFKELGFKTQKEFLAYRIVVNDIKSIAENAMNIVNNLITLKKLIQNQMLFLKELVDEELYSQVSDFNSLTHQLFEESLRAMFKRDYKQADKIISQAESLITRENDLLMLMCSKKLDPNVLAIFRLILDSSRRIMDYSCDIAELTLNMTIAEISAMQPFKK
jgi:phosphate uptake regulator